MSTQISRTGRHTGNGKWALAELQLLIPVLCLSVVSCLGGLMVGLLIGTPIRPIAAISGSVAWLIVWVCTTEWLESRASTALEARVRQDASGLTNGEVTQRCTEPHTK